jgi:hypothetical protein
MNFAPDSEVAVSRTSCGDHQDKHKRLGGNSVLVQSAVLSPFSVLLCSTHRVGSSYSSCENIKCGETDSGKPRGQLAGR